VAPTGPASEGARAVVVVRLPEGGHVGPVMATVVRALPESIGLRFEGLETEGRARLALLVLGWHRERLASFDVPQGAPTDS
jgi:hypothetical protein